MLHLRETGRQDRKDLIKRQAADLPREKILPEFMEDSCAREAIHDLHYAAEQLKQEWAEALGGLPTSDVSPETLREATEVLTQLGVRAQQEAIDASIRIERVRDGHPLGDILLAEPKDLSDLHFGTVHARARELRERDAEFAEQMAGVHSSGTKAEKYHAIQTILASQNHAPEQLLGSQAAEILGVLKDLGKWTEIISLYEKVTSDEFRSSPLIREFLAVAYHKQGEQLMKKSDSLTDTEERRQCMQEAEKSIAKSEETIFALQDEGLGNGETAGILGKIYKLKFMRLESSADPVDQTNATAYLEQSIEYLRQGFIEQGFEFYPGINWIYNQMTLAYRQNDAVAFARALSLSELVGLSVEKAGGSHTNDFWAFATLVEVSLMRGERNERLLIQLLHASQHDWELSSTRDNIARLRDQVSSLHSLEGREALLENLNWAMHQLNERMEEIIDPEKNPPRIRKVQESSAENDLATATKFFFDHGFSFGEIKTAAGGNIRYGGGLHDVVVNRWDFKMIRTVILPELELTGEETISEWNRRVDGALRFRFQTHDLRDVESQEHLDYDTFIKNQNALLALKKNDHSHTNAMIDFWLGRGECRHHAYIKQAIFDTWKTDAINTKMKEAYNALQTGERLDYDVALARIRELSRLHLLVMDQEIFASIQSQGKYHYIKDAEGQWLLDAQLNPLEDHTQNVFLVTNERGNIVEAKARLLDAFYQEEDGTATFVFGGTNQEDQLPGVRIQPLDVVRDMEVVSADGSTRVLHHVFRDGEKEVKNEATGEKIAVPIYLQPTEYSGNRASKRVILHSRDLGGPTLRGLSVQDVLPEFWKKRRFFDRQSLQQLRAYVERVRTNTESSPLEQAKDEPAEINVA